MLDAADVGVMLFLEKACSHLVALGGRPYGDPMATLWLGLFKKNSFIYFNMFLAD